MNPEKPEEIRLRELIVDLIDGDSSVVDLDELHDLMDSVPDSVQKVVNHLMLDSLLSEELGYEPMKGVVDMVVDPLGSPTADTQFSAVGKFVMFAKNRPRRLLQASGWVAAAASIAVMVFLLSGQANQSANASPNRIVEAAIRIHSEPVERVYVVAVERSTSNENDMKLPMDVKVSTQGDRFWVEMRSVRRWSWGRDSRGAIWMTLGPRRAVVVEPEEIGIPLRYIGDLYTLNLETLLRNFLWNYRLTRTEGPADTDVIIAVPGRYRTERPLKKATIEVDRESKAIRRLVLNRTYPDGTSTVSTFTLVDSHLADESLYRPQGHLEEPYRVISRETDAAKRRELIVNWFGPQAERWINVAETNSNEN